MSSVEIVLRPLFFSTARDLGEGAWDVLAGGAVRFSHVELIERGSGTRRMLSYENAAQSGEAAITTAREAIEAPRAPLLGMDLARPRVMGIVNVTPDSFSDGGEFHAQETAISHGRQIAAEGADILDIGGESTRPGSDPVDEDTECARILPVIEALAGDGVAVSCDTRKASVMRRAVGAGAQILNDISSLTYDPEARVTAAELQTPVILMHSKGEPKVMQEAPEYEDVCLEVFDTLQANIVACQAAGIPRSFLVADPGIGFGKTFDHNLGLLANIAMFHGLGVPLMLGVSRKGFLGALSGVKQARDRAVGSVSAALTGLSQGVQLFRVHDVRQTVEALSVWQGVLRGSVS